MSFTHVLRRASHLVIGLAAGGGGACTAFTPALSAQSAVLPSSDPSPVIGRWLGELAIAGRTLHFELRVDRPASSGDRELVGTFTSLDQDRREHSLDSLRVDTDSLHFVLASGRLRYDGRLTRSGDSLKLDGLWSQSGARVPLTFVRVRSDDAIARRSRPQEPRAPYPYAIADIAFPGGAAGVTLAGTLTVPRGGGAHPAVILVSGSGPQDRDHSMMGHKPFWVMADYLTRHGIAVLRIDDRGVGRSTGDFAFVVLLAAPGIPMRTLALDQIRDMLSAAGTDSSAIAFNVALSTRLIDAIRAAPASDVSAAIRRVIRETIAILGADQRELAAALEQSAAVHERRLGSPWMRWMLRHDPATELRKLRIPVFALTGDRDTQVAAAPNIDAIRVALRAAGNRMVTTRVMPGLNHLFQHARTGAIGEYALIEETLAPELLAELSGWIARSPPRGSVR